MRIPLANRLRPSHLLVAAALIAWPAIALAQGAPATPPAGDQNPYGLVAALKQGGLIAQVTFGILVLMSAASWYILFVKLFEQQKIINQAKRARSSFWQSANLREGAGKLEKNSAYRQIVDDGIQALEQHDKLTDPIDQHDWMQNSLARSQGAIASRLGTGLALLATVGSTAPFVGPVGESLIMTALGLAVAVPAVMAYNWLMRRNKAIVEELAKFTNDLHGYMMSGGAVRPSVTPARAAAGAAARPAAPSGATATGTGAGAPNPGPKKM
jgi:biopolymer transport protein ExbB